MTNESESGVSGTLKNHTYDKITTTPLNYCNKTIVPENDQSEGNMDTDDCDVDNRLKSVQPKDSHELENREIFERNGTRKKLRVEAKKGKCKREKWAEKWTKGGKFRDKPDRITKFKQFKEPKEKDNHNELFYDLKKMPVKKLFKLFDKGWEVPDDFEAPSTVGYESGTSTRF